MLDSYTTVCIIYSNRWIDSIIGIDDRDNVQLKKLRNGLDKLLACFFVIKIWFRDKNLVENCISADLILTLIDIKLVLIGWYTTDNLRNTCPTIIP